MKLSDVRKLGIKYCEENNCNYTYISHNDVEEFYLTDKEDLPQVNKLVVKSRPSNAPDLIPKENCA